MLKLQITLIAILIACVAFVSCERAQKMLEPVDTVDTGPSMPMVMDMEMHKSWMSVMLPAPTMTIMEAAAAMNPGGTGAAHGMGTRTVYFNEAGAMANMAGTAYPAETMIVKEAMDVTETFVMEVVTMTKTDDPMYAAYNGWVYGATQRASETEELMMPQTVPMEVAASCHGCHAKASNDNVFVSLSMKEDVAPETPETPETPDADAGAGDADADAGAGDADAGDDNGADANGGTDGADANGGDAQ